MTPTHEQKPSPVKTNFESLSLSMRFVLPLMLAVGWGYYQNDQKTIKDALVSIQVNQTQAVTDLKASNLNIWQTLNSFKDDTNNKFIAIYQRLK